MKRVCVQLGIVCGGKRPEWPSVSATLPPSFSTRVRQADATRRTALPADRISEYLRPFASIRGSMRNSLIFWIGLMQVVDFHDIFRYFSRFLRRPFAVMLNFLIFGIGLCKSLISMIVSVISTSCHGQTWRKGHLTFHFLNDFGLLSTLTLPGEGTLSDDFK